MTSSSDDDGGADSVRLPIGNGKYAVIKQDRRKSKPLSPRAREELKAQAVLFRSWSGVSAREAAASVPASLDGLEQLRTLGTGSFGRVRLVRAGTGGEFYALKVLRKAKLLEHEQQERIYFEKDLVEVLSPFPFVTSFYRSYQDKRRLYLLFEYVPGGELFKLVCEQGRFEPDVVRFYAAQIVVTLAYFKSLHVVYRDIKPENLLLDAQGNIRFADFGFASVCPPGQRLHSFLASAEYISPEMILGKGYTETVDMWAFGILVYELLIGLPPFMGSLDQISSAIFTIGVKFPVGSFVPDDVRDLVEGCLRVDPAERLTPEQAMAHPFFATVNFDDVLACRITPPFVPQLTSPGDTSNFNEYPEASDDDDDGATQLFDFDEF